MLSWLHIQKHSCLAHTSKAVPKYACTHTVSVMYRHVFCISFICKHTYMQYRKLNPNSHTGLTRFPLQEFHPALEGRNETPYTVFMPGSGGHKPATPQRLSLQALKEASHLHLHLLQRASKLMVLKYGKEERQVRRKTFGKHFWLCLITSPRRPSPLARQPLCLLGHRFASQ